MTSQKTNNEKKELPDSKDSIVKKVIDLGSVRQSFSHGRSKTVTVEVKKRRILNRSNLVTKHSSKNSIYSNKPFGVTDEEWKKRLRVLESSKKLIADEKESAKRKYDAQAFLAAEQKNASKEEKKRKETNIRLKAEREERKKKHFKN